MGFTTGFIGGATLTTFLLYLSLSLHERNRLHQSSLLARQTLLLDQTIYPRPPPPQSTRRTPRGEGLTERLKDKWNAELESNVRKVAAYDWRGLTDRAEDVVSGVWGRVMKGSREGVMVAGQEIKGLSAEVNEKVKEGVSEGKEIGQEDLQKAIEEVEIRRDPPRLGGLIGNRT